MSVRMVNSSDLELQKHQESASIMQGGLSMGVCLLHGSMSLHGPSICIKKKETKKTQGCCLLWIGSFFIYKRQYLRKQKGWGGPFAHMHFLSLSKPKCVQIPSWTFVTWAADLGLLLSHLIPFQFSVLFYSVTPPQFQFMSCRYTFNFEQFLFACFPFQLILGVITFLHN